MVETRHHQNDALALRLGPQRPGHAEGRGEVGEGAPERSDVGLRFRAVEGDAHEEIAGLDVVELLRLEDVEAAFEQSRRDLGDDSRPIGAGEGKRMAGGGHRLPQRTERAGW